MKIDSTVIMMQTKKKSDCCFERQFESKEFLVLKMSLAFVRDPWMKWLFFTICVMIS